MKSLGIVEMGAAAQAMSLGHLSESECNDSRGAPLSAAEAVLAEDYTTTRLRIQLEEECRAAEQYVAFELGNLRVFLTIPPDAMQYVENYASALAKRIIARRKFEEQFPRG